MPALPLPRYYTLAAAAALGATRLTAFDRALLSAGVGNMNLVRVSSVLPPQAVYLDKLDLPAGSLLPIAYGTISSGVPGQTIAAAVGVGLSADSLGMIMEFAGETGREDAERVVRAMIEEAFASRGLPLAEVKLRSAEVTVPEGQVACAFAGVPLWGGPD
ncbi:MAG: arginine decarboxylase, pyruvoyl-dependent [Bacillota bacterium]|jgi:arginine decarboxylase